MTGQRTVSERQPPTLYRHWHVLRALLLLLLLQWPLQRAWVDVQGLSPIQSFPLVMMRVQRPVHLAVGH